MLTPDDAPAEMPRADIVVYTKDDCPYCTRAKVMLDRMQKPYNVVTVVDAEMRQRFYDGWGLADGARTMPQIFVNDQRVGGYHDLVTFVAKGGLA